MNTRIVLAFTGDPSSMAAARDLAGSGAEVVTLSLDTGFGPRVDGVREQALAAGAVRSHVLDVHEEFARVALLPALRASVLDAELEDSLPALTLPLLARKLAEVAGLEQASGIAYVSEGAELAALLHAEAPGLAVTQLTPAAGAHATEGITVARPSRAGRPDCAASLEIAFEQGAPVSVNAVPLTLAELFDIVESIADDHEVRAFVPQLAYDALVEAGSDTGVVRVGLESGRCTITSAEPHVPASLVGAL